LTPSVFRPFSPPTDPPPTDLYTFPYTTLFRSTFVDAFRFMADNVDLLAHKTLQHVELSGAALGIALMIALPLGVWLGHLHRGSLDRKSTRLNSSHRTTSYAVFCLKKKNTHATT